MGVVSVFRVKPEGFSPVVEVSACFFESNGKLLFLKRSEGKPEGGQWGAPGGKFEAGENAREAVIRETFEETEICLDDEKLEYLGKLYIRKFNVDFVFHMFHQVVSEFPRISLNDEHEEYRWLTMEELTDLPVMLGGVEVLNHFRALANKARFARKPFYFIRHGETDVNADPHIKRVDCDLPLNSKGKDQAQIAREGVADLLFESVCFSPIQRAVETKDILVAGLEMEHVEMEGLGECKAHVWTEMVKLENGVGYHVCDEVEGFLERAVRAVGSALDKESPPLIVAHGGIHWALCYHMMIENHPWKIGNCELVHFRPIGDEGWEAEVLPAFSSSNE